MFPFINIIAVRIVIYVKGGFMVEEVGRKTLTKRHDGCVMDIGYLVKFLADIQTERKKLKKQLNAIKTINKDLTYYSDQYKDMTKTIDSKFMKIQTQIESIKMSAVALNRKCIGLENDIILMKKKTTSQINVAFHVWLSKSDTKSLIVKYDRVTTNIGNGYDANTGKFVAPVSGTYLLAATIIGLSGCPEHLDIFKNNHRVGMLRSEYSKDFDSGSNVIVLDLTISDVVYLKHFESGTCKRLMANKYYAYNTFSGFLIKQHN